MFSDNYIKMSIRGGGIIIKKVVKVIYLGLLTGVISIVYIFSKSLSSLQTSYSSLISHILFLWPLFKMMLIENIAKTFCI